MISLEYIQEKYDFEVGKNENAQFNTRQQENFQSGVACDIIRVNSSRQ